MVNSQGYPFPSLPHSSCPCCAQMTYSRQGHLEDTLCDESMSNSPPYRSWLIKMGEVRPWTSSGVGRVRQGCDCMRLICCDIVISLWNINEKFIIHGGGAMQLWSACNTASHRGFRRCQGKQYACNELHSFHTQPLWLYSVLCILYHHQYCCYRLTPAGP